MGFLHKLWDETLAGPTPESGLGKLRKYNSFSGTRSAADPAAVAPDEHRVQISRSITIIRNNNAAAPANRNLNVSVDSPSAPSSPASCSTPTSLFSRKNNLGSCINPLFEIHVLFVESSWIWEHFQLARLVEISRNQVGENPLPLTQRVLMLMIGSFPVISLSNLINFSIWKIKLRCVLKNKPMYCISTTWKVIFF